MLKMMAADNDDAYNLSPGFILETVEAARKFVTRKEKSEFTDQAIARFLGWPTERVRQALAQLGAIEREELSREAVKKLRTQREAIALHSTVQKARKNNQKIPHRAQEVAAERIAHREKNSGGRLFRYGFWPPAQKPHFQRRRKPLIRHTAFREFSPAHNHLIVGRLNLLNSLPSIRLPGGSPPIPCRITGPNR